MAKTLDEILRQSRTDPAALRELAEKAKKAGLTKKVIHIEIDLLTGKLKHQSSPMDSVMHLGMLEFYKVTVISNMLGHAISKEAPEEETPPAPDAPPAPSKPGQGDSDPGEPSYAENAAPEGTTQTGGVAAPAPAAPAAPEGGAPSA
jgi:hypothetical protein